MLSFVGCGACGLEIGSNAHTSLHAIGLGRFAWIDLHWSGDSVCTFAMTGDGAELDLENDDLGLTISPVSRQSPAVNWHTNAWELYCTQLHEEELTDTGYAVTSQIVGAGTFEGWIYNQTPTGLGGQEVVENSEFELKPTPQ